MVNNSLGNRQRYDVVILGTGLGGLTVALILGRQGFSVLCVSKSGDISQTNTWKAQGGIVFRGTGDTANLLAGDIRQAGAGICHDAAVDFLAQHGPEVVESFLVRDLKIPFDTDHKGAFHYTSEGAHSLPRIIHVADHTGRSIQEALQQQVISNPNIHILTDHTGVDLLTIRHHSQSYQLRYHLENECVGVYLLDNNTREVKTVFSDSVVLATGGAGCLYKHTTNSPGTIASGMVMAYRAGAYLLNTEYIQFHPTALYMTGVDRFLVSESLRGEGARLKNIAGQYFMDRYEPELKELAPRDVVTRAIVEELMATHEECVFLDLANHYTGSLPIPERFPTIYRECMNHGIDISREAIPVVPAAHYICGGVVVDTEGMTTIKRLYAVGEVSCTGIHGANRLASTSLLEAVTWGYNTALAINRRIQRGSRVPRPVIDTIPDWFESGRREDEDPALILHDWNAIQSTMWNYVGIVRSQGRLERAVSDMADLRKKLTKFYHETIVSKPIIELFQGNMAAQIISAAALRNTRSRGSHYRKT